MILDRASSVGAAWRERWESLTLFTPRCYDSLPGLPFPGDPEGYLGRDEVIDYSLSGTPRHSSLIEVSSEVRRVSTEDGRYVLDVDGRTLTAEQVVVATGPFQVPFVPELAAWARARRRAPAQHGLPEPGRRARGGCSSSAEGTRASRSRRSSAKTRSAPVDRVCQMPLPQRFLGRDLFWWLTTSRLFRTTVESRLGQRLRHRDTLIGSSPREPAVGTGVELRPRAVDATGRTVRFEDVTELEVDAVIWATGYRPDYLWIDLPVLDEHGRLRHRRGVTDVPGLFFLGLTWQHTRGSALIGWVKDDAEFVAEQSPAADRATLDRLPTSTDGLAEATRPEGGISPTETPSSSRSDPSRSGSARPRCGCWPTTARSRARRSWRPRARRSRCGRRTAVTWTRRCTGTGSASRTFDGTHETQAPIPVGEAFGYEIQLPDPGAYWYHPHIREDYGQELGLYGNILVVPEEPGYWPPVDRELQLTLDDLLLEDGKVARSAGRRRPTSPWGASGTSCSSPASRTSR